MKFSLQLLGCRSTEHEQVLSEVLRFARQQHHLGGSTMEVAALTWALGTAEAFVPEVSMLSSS